MANLRPYLALAIGIVAVSFAAIFIRRAEAPSLLIAAGRLSIAALVLAPFAAWRSGHEFRRLARQDVRLAVGAGIFLALHFATWISSLQFTTVASSVALVTTAPIWVALVSFVVLRERISRLTLAGILLSVLGSLLIGGGDFALGTRALFGDLLALLGAWAGAGYFLIGRRLRAHLSLLAYISLVYGVAALALLGVVGAARLPLWGYTRETYTMLVLLALGPQLIGHSSFNYALKFLSATFVTVVILGEPIGSTLLAMLLLDEWPPPIVLLGGATILAGIALASRGESRRAA